MFPSSEDFWDDDPIRENRLADEEVGLTESDLDEEEEDYSSWYDDFDDELFEEDDEPWVDHVVELDEDDDLPF